jgi:multidrug efflux pump subunit AcrA (membrane-fusion protein)
MNVATARATLIFQVLTIVRFLLWPEMVAERLQHVSPAGSIRYQRMESMKMESGIASPVDGLVEKILVHAGQTVETDETLLTFKLS